MDLKFITLIKNNTAVRNRIQLVMLLGLSTGSLYAQRSVVAGPQYMRSGFHQWLFGKHYRKEWSIPVSMSDLNLDSAYGGLVPYEAGGGRQSKTLRLRDRNKHEYVLRSIDKSFGAALPPVYQHTFVEKIVNDQASISHPYAAVTIAPLAQVARIYHTNPQFYYVPTQRALDSFNNRYGNQAYLLEQRPDENWQDAPNFGNAKNIISTEKMLEKLHEKNERRIDQELYVRSRLFDMFIGDGSRHEDQWRWGEFKTGDQTIYKPIPRDRDQAYARFDGWLVRAVLYMSNINHLQTFKADIPNVNTNNFPSRNLDRSAANEMTRDTWIRIAKELQGLLTDQSIDEAIKRLPPEVYPVSGPKIASILKQRRDHLEKYAGQYYDFLARGVDITGSAEREIFQVTRLPHGETAVTVSRVTPSGIETIPYYSRVFKRKETKEIRLYGLGNNDVYRLSGNTDKGSVVRIIGGFDADTIIDRSFVKGAEPKTLVYDDRTNNSIVTSKETKLHLSTDSSIHAYRYDEFRYNYRRLRPVVFFSFEDKIHVGAAYTIKRYGWRSEPYKNIQNFQVNYSVTQKAFSFGYKADFKDVIGKWGLLADVSYDLLRWTNYFGIGNNTVNTTKTTNYYRMETVNGDARLGFYRTLGRNTLFTFGPAFNSVEVLKRTGTYVDVSVPNTGKIYGPHYYGGGFASLVSSHVDHPVVPHKGIYVALNAQYLKNLEESKEVWRYDAQLQGFVPLIKHMVLAIRPAVAHITGEPEFFQYPSIGSSNTMRGYSRDRFRGTTTFYSDQELQYFFISGRYGITGFYDVGRVWLKGEQSSTWHTGYGAGIIVAPFEKVLASATYGMSKDGNFIHIRIYRRLGI